MPWILYRYILRDLLKNLALSTTVLVMVMSFAVAIKPLSEGLLGAMALAKFIVYTMPTMLQFALPFSGAFASVMVFSRLVQDNEVTACSASGMSYRSILAPVMLVGVVLMLTVFFLGNWVVPWFYERAAMTIERDVARLLVSQLEKRQAWTDRSGRWMVYADGAANKDLSPQEVALLPAEVREGEPRWIGLEGVAFTERDRQGKVRSEATAQRADALMYRRDGQMHVSLVMHNVTLYDPQNDRLVHASTWNPPPYVPESGFRDKPQFLSWPQLQKLRQTPERFDQIGGRKAKLAQALAQDELIERIMAELASDGGRGAVTLMGSDGKRYTLRSPVVERSGLSLAMSSRGDAPVRVESSSSGVVMRKVEAASAKLTVRTERVDAEPQVTIELLDARVVDTHNPGRVAEQPELTLPKASLPGEHLAAMARQDLSSLLKLADQAGPRAGPVAEAAGDLRAYIRQVSAKIITFLHQRAASSVSSMFILVIGALLSLLLRTKIPLVVYFWGFVIAAATVMISQGGGTMATRPGFDMTTGLVVIWAGDLVLLLAAGVIYMRLSRH